MYFLIRSSTKYCQKTFAQKWHKSDTRYYQIGQKKPKTNLNQLAYSDIIESAKCFFSSEFIQNIA